MNVLLKVFPSKPEQPIWSVKHFHRNISHYQMCAGMLFTCVLMLFPSYMKTNWPLKWCNVSSSILIALVCVYVNLLMKRSLRYAIIRKMMVMMPRAKWFCHRPQLEKSMPWLPRYSCPDEHLKPAEKQNIQHIQLFIDFNISSV